MRRAWATVVGFIEWVTLPRAVIALELLAVLAFGLLGAARLLQDQAPTALAMPPEPPVATPAGADGLALLPVSNPGAAPVEGPGEATPQAPAGSDAALSPAPLPLTPEGVDEPLPEPTLNPDPSLNPTPLPVEADDLNILLLGCDRRPGADPSWRTDTIIVVAIRPRDKVVGMLSLPRDLWVRIPGQASNRINTVDYLGERVYGAGGGPRLLGATLQENLNIPVQAYVRVNFVGLERIIDALGGITLNVDRYYNEKMDGSASGSWRLQLAPGVQHVDGRTAVGYARSRRYTDDLDRNRRQQQVLLAIRDAALRPSVLPQLPRLLAALNDAVDTNLTPGQILSLIGLAVQLEPSSYRTRVVDRTMVRDWTTPGGAMVLLPNLPRIKQAWIELTTP